MEKDDEVDLLVIGQGLAGSALAMRALQRNYKVLVMDEPGRNITSRVAAGLFNPVTGRKMSKTWLADELFPSLHRYYTEVEQLTGERFFYPMPIYRAFGSAEEQNEWMGKSAGDAYDAYIDSVSTGPAFGDNVNDRQGGMTLKQCGYLDTQRYLDAVREHLTTRAGYIEHRFDPLKLEIGLTHVRYGARPVRARKIVFCQGVHGASNPWFGTLPVRSLKGEFLTIQCELENSVILNRGVYMVPGPWVGEWRVGATFNRDDHQPDASAWARQELTRKLEDLIRLPYRVTGQQWGFRPTTPDRRPLLGAHPKHESLIIFNGLGTKGVSLAPYFSEVLIRWMEGDGMINKEADLSRFN